MNILFNYNIINNIVRPCTEMHKSVLGTGLFIYTNMKIKDLEKGRYLKNMKVKLPDNIKCDIREGYWQSSWSWPKGYAGVWLQRTENVGLLEDRRVVPVFLNNIEQTLEWEVLAKPPF